MNDKYGFLREPANWANHLPLLLLALDETRSSPHPILELGVNNDSSPLIREYCVHEGKRSVVIDDDIMRCASIREREYKNRYEVRCADYEQSQFDRESWSVAIISNAPGERRARDAKRLASHAEIVIVRDSEPAADYGYKYSEIWEFFRSRVDVKTVGAWSSAISNALDLSKWRGTKLGPYVISGGDDDKVVSKVAETIKDFQLGKVEWK